MVLAISLENKTVAELLGLLFNTFRIQRDSNLSTVLNSKLSPGWLITSINICRTVLCPCFLILVFFIQIVEAIASGKLSGKTHHLAHADLVQTLLQCWNPLFHNIYKVKSHRR